MPVREPSPNIRDLPIETAIKLVDLIDPENAFLAGSRAVEMHVGRAALELARQEHGVEESSGWDVDLVVSRGDYRSLRKKGAHVVQHAFRRLSGPGRYRVNSLSLYDGAFDIWRERWYEAARYPKGIIGVDELYTNSDWDPELGVRVLTKDYLIDQRERSIKFLEEKMEKGKLTPAEATRLQKDRADLSVLR